MRDIRYQGAIIKDHKILLIRHQELQTGRTYWLFPGGGMEPGETEEECVKREMKEETNLEVKVGPLLLNEQPVLNDPAYGIIKNYKTYLCEPLSDEARAGFEPEPGASEVYNIAEIRWFDLKDEKTWGTIIVDDPLIYLPLQLIRKKLRYFSGPEMTANEVIKFLDKMENRGIQIWIDGGWGIDAQLGNQKRPHSDLDIFVHEKDVFNLRALLNTDGYREIKMEIARPHNFVFGDEYGHEIDEHVFVVKAEQKIVYGPIENGDISPINLLDGVGIINGRKVRCISPEWMVKFHIGYKLRESDFKDIPALCKKFGINLPKEYIR